jgi:hypothetical protein
MVQPIDNSEEGDSKNHVHGGTRLSLGTDLHGQRRKGSALPVWLKTTTQRHSVGTRQEGQTDRCGQQGLWSISALLVLA